MENTMYTEEEIRQAIAEAVSNRLSEYCVNSIIKSLKLNKREMKRKEGIKVFLEKWIKLHVPNLWTISVILSLLEDYNKEINLLSNSSRSEEY